jgi:ligand-binding SRPBCC domain-containing protein
MGTESFQSEQWVPYPVELVFAFFANPSNLLHITPPRLKARMETLRVVPPSARPVADDPARRFQSIAAGVGSELKISFRPFPWFPVRIRWTARIVEFVWNSYFADEQVSGLFSRFRHRHGIEPQMRNGMEGTLVSDQVEFALPGGWLGALASGRARRELESQFAARQERLLTILESASRQARRQRS